MERVPCEFFLIRYVPDVVKDEFVNIGVVLREAAGARRAAVRFTRDWRRVRCVDADADVGLLEGMEQEIGRRLEAGVSVRDAKGVIEGFEDTLSNSLQMTQAKATLAENMATEMELLMRMYVEPLKAVQSRSKLKSGRAMILDAMRKKFDEVGAWKVMRKQIRIAQYTEDGDPLRIDCGYEFRAERATSEAILRMFQAVSLSGDVDAAKGLALSAKRLRETVLVKNGLALQLNAVVEPLGMIGDPADEDDENLLRYRFGKRTMEDESIRVLTIHELDGSAKTAKRELLELG